MKKFILFLCSFAMAVSVLAACGKKPAASQSYVLTLKAEGGTLDYTSLSVDYNKNYALPTPTRVGYTFAGWKDENGTAYETSGVWATKSGATLVAHWTANTYKITFDLDGGAFAEATPPTEVTATYDQAPPTLPTPTKSGYTFSGWTYEEKALPEIWNYTSNIVVKANWVAVAVEKCTITFVQSGQANIEKEVEKGGTLTDIPTPVQVPGYTYVWDRTDFTNITENDTVNAVATPITYTVTFDANNGQVSQATMDVVYKADYTLPTPTRENYIFAGWMYKTDSVGTSGKWSIASNVTLTAVWTPVAVKTFKIILNVPNGKLLPAGQSNIVTVEYGKAYDLSSYTVEHNDKDEYSFYKWVKADTKEDFAVSGMANWDYENGTEIVIEAVFSSNWTGFY